MEGLDDLLEGGHGRKECREAFELGDVEATGQVSLCEAVELRGSLCGRVPRGVGEAEGVQRCNAVPTHLKGTDQSSNYEGKKRKTNRSYEEKK